MPQGYTLRPPRAAASVQDQGNVVSRGLGCGNTGGGIQQVNVALVGHFHREYRDLAVRGGAAHEFRAYRGAKQNAGIGVTEEKMKLFIGIRRVQRGCGSGNGGGEKAHNRRQSVGQCNRYRIANTCCRSESYVTRIPSSGTIIAVWLSAKCKTSRRVCTDFSVIRYFLSPRVPGVIAQSCLLFTKNVHKKRSRKTFTKTRCRSPALSSRARERSMNLDRVAFCAQDLSELFQEKLHVIIGGQRAHHANAEDFAGERPKTAGDFNARLVQQAFSHFRLVNTFWDTHRVQGCNSMLLGNVHA